MGIHENLTYQECDELTRNAQTIHMMLSFGAYREVLTVVSALSTCIHHTCTHTHMYNELILAAHINVQINI